MQKKELESLLKRVQADFDNYRKRVEQERHENRKFATADLLSDLLPVLDNFKRAAEHAPDDNWAKGIQAIGKQLEDTLRRHGLETISVKPGDQFDPRLHEAIDSKQSSNGTVSEVVAAGYRLHGKVLRPAKVK